MLAPKPTLARRSRTWRIIQTLLVCLALLLAAAPALMPAAQALAQGGKGALAADKRSTEATNALPGAGNGLVSVWGLNRYGELGTSTNNGTFNDNPTPVVMNGLSGVVAIAAGDYHNLALKGGGTVWAWGSNEFGELGTSTNNGTENPNRTPTQVPGLSGVVAISAGYAFNLALKSDGTVWAWGINHYGQLGNTTNSGDREAANPTPRQVNGLSNVVAISAGSYHSLALKSDGTIWAWGNNEDGELGNSTNIGVRNTPNPTPTQVAAISSVTAISGGGAHSLALKSDGTVWAWGYNYLGELGNSTNVGTSNPNPTPTQVNGLSGVVAVDAGDYHNLVIKSDGTVWAWGANEAGQLGNSTGNGDYTTAHPTPVEVTGLSSATVVAAGGSHSLAVRPDGTIWAWGANNYGQLGNSTNSGDYDAANPTPTKVAGLSHISAISTSYAHSMSLSDQLAENIVKWLDPVNVSTSSDSITRNNSAAAWSAGAASERAISSGTGYVQAQVGNANDSVIFGLGSGNDDQTGNDIEFGIYFNGATHTAQAIKSNSTKGTAVSFAAADVFEVAVESGPVIRFYKNGVVFYTDSAPIITYPLRLDTSLYNPGAAIKYPIMSGANLTVVTERPSVPLGTCSSVTWNTSPGYTTNATVVNGPPATIQKTSGVNNAWDAGSSSTQSFGLANAPVFAEATVNSASDYFVFGLSVGDSNAKNTDIDWGIYGYGATQQIKAVSAGAGNITLGTMSSGDVLRVQFTSNGVKFFSNGTPLLVGNYPGGNPYFPALLDTSLYNTNAKLLNVRLCSSSGTTNLSTGKVSGADEAEALHIDLGATRPEQQPVNFSDVQPDDYYYTAVQYLGSQGAVSGYADGTFRPNVGVTRAQMAKMMVLASGEPLRNPAEASFNDVAVGSTFYQYVETARWMGMISGYADGSFGPNAGITRGQLAKMAVLGAAIPLQADGTAHFGDVATNSPFYNYVETAQAHGLISGYADGTFRPGATATRGQVAKIIYVSLTAER